MPTSFRYLDCQCSVDVDPDTIRATNQPIKIQVGPLQVEWVNITKWFPTKPIKPLSIQKYVGEQDPETLPHYDAVATKIEVMEVVKRSNATTKVVETPNSLKLVVLTKSLRLGDIRQMAGADKFLRINVVVPLYELVDRTTHGFKDYLQNEITDQSVMLGLSDWSYKVVGHLPPSDEEKHGSVILEVTVNVGELL